MSFKLKGSIAISAVGLFFLFFVLFIGFQQEYEKQVKGYLDLKNFYFAKSLSDYSSMTFHEENGTRQSQFFKNGEVRLTKVRDRLKLDVRVADRSFVFMKNLSDLPLYQEKEEEKQEGM